MMNKILLGLVATLVMVTPVLAETAPTIGTDEYCWALNADKPLAYRHDAYFDKVTPENPTGCHAGGWNTAWHEKYDDKVFIQPQNVPYVNDYTSRTLRTTDLWGSPEELKAKLCVATPAPIQGSHIPAIMRIGRKDKYVAALQKAAVELGLMNNPKEWGRVDQATAEAFAMLLE